jgi:hypothetical protein
MRTFKDINLLVFFGLINDRRIFIKISPTTARNVVTNEIIKISTETKIVILF